MVGCVGEMGGQAPRERNTIVNLREDRMWTYKTGLRTILVHFPSSRIVLDVANKFMECRCISFPNNSLSRAYPVLFMAPNKMQPQYLHIKSWIYALEKIICYY